MKTCYISSCTNPCFSHGVCLFHYKRSGIKSRQPKTKQNKAPNKRELDNITYRERCQEIDEKAIETGHKECIFCNKQIEDRDWPDRTHHHQHGRTGKLLIDERYIKLAHFDCHSDYHHKSVSLLWWWDDYLERIKDDTKLYNKELKRTEKSKQ